MTVVAEILAGLGLLFVGLKTLSSHLQTATGRRVRHILRSATRSPLIGLLAGTLAGAATQSSNAVAIICGNLVRGGVFTTRDAIPVVAGGNVGTAVLVFVAAFDFRLVVFYLLAVVGFGFHFRLDKRPGWKEWLWVGLGLALALLGLDFIKQGPREMDVTVLAQTLDSGLAPWMGFLIGVAAATLTQSSSTPTILVLALIQSRLLGLEDAFYLVLGANLGSGFATLIASGELEGTGRQLCYVHILVKSIGCALMFAAWAGGEALGLSPESVLLGAGAGQAWRLMRWQGVSVVQHPGAPTHRRDWLRSRARTDPRRPRVHHRPSLPRSACALARYVPHSPALAGSSRPDPAR